MGRAIHKLKPVEVPRLAKGKLQKLHGDGGGLYLRVAPPNGASWVFRFMIDGQARTMGLGPYPDISLADARTRAAEARRIKLDGLDPIETREAVRAAKRQSLANAMTFRECAVAYIKAHETEWKNPKHAAQWPATLEKYAYPVFGDLQVSAVDTALVLKVLEPIWKVKTETASRVRQRIEAVLDWAASRGKRAGNNPARWKGHLVHQLSARQKVAKVAHQPALPYDDLGDFMSELRKQVGFGAMALEFTILTAARTSEVLEARWGEFDLVENTWIVPADRMKVGREHRVPLSARAVEILEKMKASRTEKALPADAFVFPGAKIGRSLSNMTMLKVLERMNDAGDKPRWVDHQGRRVVPHGFRSTFSDWASETTSYPRDVIEMALAHTIKNKAEAAYRRGDLFDKRRDLMAAWATACTAPAGGNIRVLKKVANA